MSDQVKTPAQAEMHACDEHWESEIGIEKLESENRLLKDGTFQLQNKMKDACSDNRKLKK